MSSHMALQPDQSLHKRDLTFQLTFLYPTGKRKRKRQRQAVSREEDEESQMKHRMLRESEITGKRSSPRTIVLRNELLCNGIGTTCSIVKQEGVQLLHNRQYYLITVESNCCSLHKV
ncbi:UNVERIFIED_CONTAM: hypothetical protein FKN15_032179 [Acipenser sinensis]